ncbi:hypothetical protein LPW11_04180 [Geomonas sp. RF6]|uniref:hypothetical protein n=1 Tax=Geomonas sp. RF6 TaxID=2897342 RepID=UPI001E3C6E56|nr:hypothetical protein [Geomonas sp. RF6]UFS71397.1 hypothetical protein LPW11_04180 [Geomonas sp. RF6]
MGVKKVLGLLLMFPLLCASWAQAAEIHGRSSTQLIWYENDLLNNGIHNGNETSVELAEYLRLGITNIDKAGKFSIYGYGRGSQDFTSGQGLNGRLYYLYGDLRDLFDNRLDLRIGRQWVNYAAGSAIIDGFLADVKNLGPVPLVFTVMGGHDVRFSLDGEFGNITDTAMGAGVALALKDPPKFFRNTQAEFSWFRRMHQDEIIRDVLGGTLTQYLLNNLKLYGNARYDLVTESFNEVQGGIKYYPLSNLVFTGEYYESFPAFDTTSIYSVFAVDQYQEAVFRVDYTFNDIFTVHGGYTREWFGEGATANVYLAGVGVHPVAPLQLNVEFDQRTGYYGSITGVLVDALFDINKQFQLAAGFNWDVYQRQESTGEEIARQYWFGGKAKLAKNMAVSARLQDDVNIRYESNWSGRVVLDYDF